ncbi:hypothetical protein GGR52DRAFT_451765 [Hypoxylon sp. FL1284]|nr:hypothetical protein GGR52DRAFT_451765 [Hypoxylon sp. FL1284]
MTTMTAFLSKRVFDWTKFTPIFHWSLLSVGFLSLLFGFCSCLFQHLAVSNLESEHYNAISYITSIQSPSALYVWW